MGITESIPLSKINNVENISDFFSQINTAIRTKDGTQILFSEMKLFFQSNNNFYFHGTNSCNALAILRDGFQIKKKGNLSMGPGVYLNKNINHSLRYGNCIFVCFLKIKNTFDFGENFTEQTDLHLYDSFIMNKDKICVKKPENVEIEYIIEMSFNKIKRTPNDNLYQRSLDSNNFKKYISCIINEKERYLEILDKTNSKKIQKEIEELINLKNLWVIGLNIKNVYEFLNYTYISKIDEHGNKRIQLPYIYEIIATKELFSEFWFPNNVFFVVGKLHDEKFKKLNYFGEIRNGIKILEGFLEIFYIYSTTYEKLVV